MSKAGVWLLCRLNRLFPLPVHPFNRQDGDGLGYARWQYEKGAQTLRFYRPYCTPEEMFEGKRVLDVGCGAGGKSLYYAHLGAQVVGVDLAPGYESQAQKLCRELGFSYGEDFLFQCVDAARLPFADESFDTVILNDAMEHVAQPEEVLAQALRVLRPGGRVFINFPPYHHPYGAHLSDAIGVPWVHWFFSEHTLVAAYKALVQPLKDGAARVALRISQREDGTEYFSYINRMTIRRFRGILRRMGLVPEYWHEAPLRNFLAPLCRVPCVREAFVKMVVCVLRKA